MQGDRDSKEEIAKVFALFDHEGTGKISFRDLKRVVTELGENIPDEELREMIEEADKDQDGFVVFEDFYKILKKVSFWCFGKRFISSSESNLIPSSLPTSLSLRVMMTMMTTITKN